jgi:hypothetical protein
MRTKLLAALFTLVLCCPLQAKPVDWQSGTDWRTMFDNHLEHSTPVLRSPGHVDTMQPWIDQPAPWDGLAWRIRHHRRNLVPTRIPAACVQGETAPKSDAAAEPANTPAAASPDVRSQRPVLGEEPAAHWLPWPSPFRTFPAPWEL